MNENELALRLSQLEIPGRGAALDRCLDAYRESATVHERPARRLRFVPRRQFRLALVLAVVAGIVALAFTPPGRAVADWVADLVGVGEPSTVAFEPFGGQGWKPESPEATVIASGLTAWGDPFEWVLQGAKKGICFRVQFPARRRPGGGGACIERIPRLYSPITFSGSSSGAGVEVHGFVRPDVQSVRLSYPVEGETQTIDAVMGRISPELMRKTGGNPNKPRGVFIAFLPEGGRAEEVTATAYDAEGNAVGTAGWTL